MSDHNSTPTEGKRSGMISRVSRACNNCRRMKMRCVGADDPPCKRCRHGGLDCVMEKPGKPQSEDVPYERMRSLEDQVSSIQHTLSDLVTLLRAQPSLSGQPMLGGSSSSSSLLDPASSSFMPVPTHFPSLGENSHAISSVSNDSASWHNLLSGRGRSPGAERRGWNDTKPDVHKLHRLADASHARARPPSPSLPPSRALSVGPDDILGADHISRPLESMSNMAGLVEAAMERAQEDAGEKSQPTSPRSNKRTRFSSPTHSAIHTPHSLPHGKHNRPMLAYPDPVAEGLVSEVEGKKLVQIFFDGCHDFMPCYDPNVDTWESLRLRSPFSITCLIMVGARVRDGGGPPSKVQTACRLYAQRIAAETLFTPVDRVEAIQAMILLAVFSDRGWLPGGHAVRMGVKLCLDEAFGRLLRGGMGAGKSKKEVQSDQELVTRARVWLCLYLFEHQMAYGNGRPAILREDQTIKTCRRLLEHPLSIPSDARLVSMVELTALRAPLHSDLASSEATSPEALVARLQRANVEFNQWENYWTTYSAGELGKGPFFHESLAVQRHYAELFANSQLLRDTRSPEDAQKLSEEQRFLAMRSIQNARTCLDVCLRNPEYRKRLRYAVHFTHVCAAFAASFLLRITRVFPDQLDLAKTLTDVEELALLLSDIPAGRYARSLKLLLRRAKRRSNPSPSHAPTGASFPWLFSKDGGQISPSFSTTASGTQFGELDTFLSGTSLEQIPLWVIYTVL